MATNKNAGEVFHRLIKRVRDTQALPDIRFIRSKGFRTAEKPVVGYLAACEVEETACQRGFMKTGKKGQSIDKYTLSGAVWHYAPKNTSADSLAKMSELLMRAISTADSEGYVVSAKLKPVDFSKDADTLFQKLLINLEFYLEDTADFSEWTAPCSKSTSVFADGVALSGVKSVLCTDETKYHPVKELLMGTVEYVPTEVNYIIKLCLGCEGVLPKNSGFTLVVETVQYVNSYSDCRVLKSEKCVKSPNEYEREYTIAATVKSEVII